MHMYSKIVVLTAMAMAGVGCGSSATTSFATSMPLSADELMVEEVPEAARVETAMDVEASFAAFDLSALPVAPWSAAPLPSTDVPAPLLAAWARAENRATCAPLAPGSMGRADGAEARVSSLVEGGWAVEFDRRGMPGMSADGEGCARCGRGVFGIAGTRMSPDEIVTESDEADVPTPSFADGSHLAMEEPGEGETVAAATLAVRGQGCVYQVWSFLGPDHLRELVGGLRMVEVRTETPLAAR